MSWRDCSASLREKSKLTITLAALVAAALSSCCGTRDANRDRLHSAFRYHA
jgi:hypothetical protein